MSARPSPWRDGLGKGRLREDGLGGYVPSAAADSTLLAPTVSHRCPFDFAQGKRGGLPARKMAGRPWRDFGVQGHSKTGSDFALKTAGCPHFVRMRARRAEPAVGLSARTHSP